MHKNARYVYAKRSKFNLNSYLSIFSMWRVRMNRETELNIFN